MRPAIRRPGYAEIEKNDHEIKIEIDCGNLQPGRKVWTDAFFLGIGQSCNIEILGHLFSANLPQPKPFSLFVSAEITQTQMTVEELTRLGEPNDEE